MLYPYIRSPYTYIYMRVTNGLMNSMLKRGLFLCFLVGLEAYQIVGDLEKVSYTN